MREKVRMLRVQRGNLETDGAGRSFAAGKIHVQPLKKSGGVKLGQVRLDLPGPSPWAAPGYLAEIALGGFTFPSRAVRIPVYIVL